MTIPIERWLLDTNIWIFGLRREKSLEYCEALLKRIGSFVAVIPLQVLKELNVNLSEDEIRDFYRLLNQYPEGVQSSWHKAPLDRIRYYEDQGCRKGDAVIAAHAEVLSVDFIITENRQFLQTIKDLRFGVLRPADAIGRLINSSDQVSGPGE
ncbi:MAG: hypothetical protein JWM21_1393 [Acidobacteria bacterium]|nr:hypothetical protein [Acidobacteriota bacterium]